MKSLAFALTLALTIGCVHFKETYHFAGVDPVTKKEQNHYRVQVTGKAGFSKARYVAGYYDERALDLYFNEIKAGSEPGKDIPRVFEDDVNLPGTDERLKPLTGEDGVFLMIFSTNAKAVTDTIGQFAENQVAADAITNLVNSSEISRVRSDAARLTEAIGPRADAVSTELQSLIDALPQGSTPDKDATRESAVRILNAIAAELGATRPFTDIDEAGEWFRGRAARGALQ